MLTVITDMACKLWGVHRQILLAITLGCLTALVTTAAGGEGITLRGEVVAITDGDTLTLLQDSRQYHIRLAQIDAPEGGQAWGRQARQALADKVFRQQISIEVVTTDQYGRQVGVVLLQGRDINREMISEGHAWAYLKYLTDPSLLEDESAAKAAGRGLWAAANALPPWQWRHDNPRPVAQSAAERAPEGTDDCRIKGNINAKGDKIYHLPGQRYYQQTQISTARGERWFCSQSQARSAGWRKSRA